MDLSLIVLSIALTVAAAFVAVWAPGRDGRQLEFIARLAGRSSVDDELRGAMPEHRDRGVRATAGDTGMTDRRRPIDCRRRAPGTARRRPRRRPPRTPSARSAQVLRCRPRRIADSRCRPANLARRVRHRPQRRDVVRIAVVAVLDHRGHRRVVGHHAASCPCDRGCISATPMCGRSAGRHPRPPPSRRNPLCTAGSRDRSAW